MSLFNSYASHEANGTAVHRPTELSLQVNAVRPQLGPGDGPVALGASFINRDVMDENSGACGSKVLIVNKMNIDANVIGEVDVISVTGSVALSSPPVPVADGTRWWSDPTTSRSRMPRSSLPESRW
jgi:hypothetical protein